MLSEKFRPIIEPFTAGAGKTLARAHVSPNALTTVGLVGTLVCAGLIATDRRVLAGVLLIPSVVVDVLDGALARATGRVTSWGGFYDSVADRIGDGALLAAIAWSARAGHPRLLGISLVTIVLSFLVSYARAKAEALGVRVAGGPGERAERVVILIAGLLFGSVEAAVWLIAVLTAITFAGRCAAVRRQTREP